MDFQGLSPAAMTALRNLSVDEVTGEVFRALRAAGIPSLVLKGPAIASWIYDPGEVRGYGDTDLMVSVDDWDRAVRVLRRLGFAHEIEEMGHPRMESIASDPWYRGSATLDLHATLYGIGAPPREAWRVLGATAVPLRVGREELVALGPAARVLHIALHVAQHQAGKPIIDLERAVARLDEAVWQEAKDIAAQLDALPAFNNGLSRIPAGAALATRLGVAGEHSVEIDLRASQVPLAEGLYTLVRATGWRARLRAVVAELAPTAEFMRWWSPLARRGRVGLTLAYAWRPVYLLLKAPAAARTVWRALHR
jgi:hypothetical protein